MRSITNKEYAIAAVFAVAMAVGGVALSMAANPAPQVIHVTAKKFEYTPRVITLKKGVPVVLELTSVDRLHGFNVPALGVRADVLPGQTARVNVVPQKTGTFPFHCDNFCGSGHPNMTGEIVVVD